MATSELRLLAELAFDSGEWAGDGNESLAELVREAVQEARQHGQHLIVLLPISWRLAQALEIDPAAQRGGGAERPDWVPADAVRGAFQGRIDGVPAFQVHDMPEARIVVMAVDGFVRWRQWRLDDGVELAVEVTTYSEDDARALASEHPDLLRTADRTTVDARAREIRKAVLLDVYERFTTDVAHPQAAYWLTVPEELRR